MFLFLLSVTVNTSKLHLQLDLFNNSVYSERIYITTDDGGLVAFDPRDSTWILANSLSGLPSNKTKDVLVRGDSVFVLAEGGITIFDKELTRINFQDFNSLFFTQDTDPYCIILYKNKVILGGQHGVQWFNLNNFGRLTRVVEHINYNFQVFEILPLDTCYLLGTSRGVFKADTNFRDTVLIDNYGYVYSLLVYDGSVWAGGSLGCKEIFADTAVFSNDTVWTVQSIDNQIYIGTNRGLYRYVNNWQQIQWSDIRGFARVYPSNLIVSIARGNGLLYEGSGSYIFPPGLASNEITDLTQTPDGKIYVSSKSGLVSVFDGDSWKVLNRGNPWSFPGGALFNIESDSQGRIYLGLWFWEQDYILYCWDMRNDTMPSPISLPVVATTASGMFVDSNDDLWVGLFVAPNVNNKVLKMHRVSDDSLEWTTYSNPRIIWKRVFAEGREGIYCGNSPTDGGAGIHILREDNSVSEITRNLGSSTLSMASDLNGNIWAGLEDKLIYISEENVEREYASLRFEGLAVDFQGGIWGYNTESGLSYLSPEGIWESLPQELRNFQSFILKDVISPLHFIDNNRLFVGTYKGLYEFELNFNYPDSGQINVYPNPFNYQRHNRLYFSARDLGGKNILIYDIVGKIKGNYAIPPEYDEVYWIEKDQLELSSGLYLYYLADGGRVIHKGKFVVVR